MDIDKAVSGSGLPVPSPPDQFKAVRRLLFGIFLIAAIYALYFAREFFMPVVLAFLLALMLTPIVRFLRRHGIPEPVSATLLVLASVVGVTVAGYLLSGPIVGLIDEAPQIGREFSARLSELRRPFQRVLEASEQVDQVAEAGTSEGVQKVVVAQPGIVSRAAGSVMSAGTSMAIIFVLSLFLLASGPLFYEKIIQSFPRLSEKKRALRVVYDVEREISRYLLTVALINAALGLAIGPGLWAIGVPDALVWGAAATLLNFLPYIGAVITVLMVTIISLVTFDSLAHALLGPAFALFCYVVEGQFLTPLVLGRRLEINAVAIFIAVAFWSWLWGFVGALIAVPLLVIVKVFCDHFENLHHVGNFLAAHQTADPTAEAEANRQATPVG